MPTPSPASTARLTPSVPGSCMAITRGTPASRSFFSTSWRVREPVSGTMNGVPPRSESATFPKAAIFDGTADQAHVEDVLGELVEDLVRGANVEEDLRLRPEPLVRLDHAGKDVHAARRARPQDQSPLAAAAQLVDCPLRLVLG